MRNIQTKLFDITTVKRPAVQGSLLVSEPFLRERYFMHAVISLIDVPSDGSSVMGVVLNNSTALMLPEIFEDVRSERQIPVYCGGPLSQDRLFFVHTLGDKIIPDAFEYTPGLWVGGSIEAMTDYINSGYPTDGVVRFFLGYSGWEQGQLDSELERDVWAVGDGADVTPAELLTLHGDRMWHRVVCGMGPEYRIWHLHPISPHAN